MLEIKHIIDDLAWSGGRRMQFSFVLAPREWNVDADALSNRAFN